ncbi:hypothetical protein BS50DRAFT_567101 [Corynespora cassiicola Philippines]|uniref:MYND-type zinc finger protein samB n=1 Tax=Corynespora cassiicola Philippines TaxID=1448308 RepID=A0A2T2PA50_CORCC|nr:hypothetical protein BS50DRAFT_567101 [Corynespora cassiicola Philippines]
MAGINQDQYARSVHHEMIFREAEVNAPINKCAVCDQLPKIACGPCLNAVVVDEHGNKRKNLKFYCSQLCLQADRPSHNAECERLFKQKVSTQYIQRAQNAGLVAFEIFETLVSRSWQQDIKRVKVTRSRDKTLVAIEVTPAPAGNTGPPYLDPRGELLYQFPPANLQNQRDQDIIQAMLADRNSVWAFIIMDLFVKYLFKDLVDDVENDILEINHGLQEHVHHIVKHMVPEEQEKQPYSDCYGEKGVYMIKLKSGDHVSLDLTGKQYNLGHEPVTPWADYWETWVTDILDCVQSGTHFEIHQENLRSMASDSPAWLKFIMELLFFCERVKNTFFSGRAFKLEELNGLHGEELTKKIKQATHLLDGNVRLWELFESPNAPMSVRYPAEEGYSSAAAFDPTSLHRTRKTNWEEVAKVAFDPNIDERVRNMNYDLLKYQCSVVIPGGHPVMYCDFQPCVDIPDKYLSINPYAQMMQSRD